MLGAIKVLSGARWSCNLMEERYDGVLLLNDVSPSFFHTVLAPVSYTPRPPSCLRGS
jgi:hypothetical protein